MLKTPATRKTQVRGPDAWTQLRSEPEPESLVVVTSITAPPRPPTDSAPPPSAPGKAGQPEFGQLAEEPDGDVAAETVTFAVADMLASAWLVAVIVSVSGFDGAR